ncbi:MAG: exo-alpha-sialidase [Planctomycetales bacterium]|nr:exo-alpha-sialidase [Planctomycetales bacterium]
MSMHPIALLICSIFLATLPLPCRGLAAEPASYPRVTVFRNGQDGYKIFRIPAVVKAVNGDLLAFCEAREGGDASKIDLVMKRSTDQGRTWSPLQVVQSADSFVKYFRGDVPPITVGNPAPVVDRLDERHPGRIHLPFTLENDRVFICHSDDHGATWSPPREITSTTKQKEWGWYATGPVHSIQLERGPHRGRLVVPTDHRLGADGADHGPNGVHALLSDDHGETWRIGAIDATYEDGLNANETTVVELNDGRLCFNTRDQNGAAAGTRGVGYSSDGGETFDNSGDRKYRFFVPAPAVLDPPVVQCAMLRAASTLNGDKQNVILFSGPDESGPTGKGRSDLRLRYSLDETRSWQDGPLLHIGPAAYSDLVQLSGTVEPNKASQDNPATDPERNREFGVLFEAGAANEKSYTRIDFLHFRLSDVLDAKQP